MIRNGACFGIVVVLTHLTSGCASIPVDQRERIRNEINAAAEDALVAFTAEDPAIAEEIEDSVGYASVVHKPTSLNPANLQAICRIYAVRGKLPRPITY